MSDVLSMSQSDQYMDSQDKLDNVQVNSHIVDTMQDRARRAKDRAASTGQLWHCVGNGTM